MGGVRATPKAGDSSSYRQPYHEEDMGRRRIHRKKKKDAPYLADKLSYNKGRGVGETLPDDIEGEKDLSSHNGNIKEKRPVVRKLESTSSNERRSLGSGR